MTPATTPPVDAGSIVPSRSCYRWPNDSVSENVFGPVPRSPCDNSPSLCRWWRSAGVAGSAGAPTPRGSCRGVRRRTREPVPGLRLAAACGRPLLAGSWRCSVESCNLSLAIARTQTPASGLPSRRTWFVGEQFGVNAKTLNLALLPPFPRRPVSTKKIDRALKTLRSTCNLQFTVIRWKSMSTNLSRMLWQGDGNSKVCLYRGEQVIRLSEFLLESLFRLMPLLLRFQPTSTEITYNEKTFEYEEHRLALQRDRKSLRWK